MISISEIIYKACSSQLVLVFFTIIVITFSLFSNKMKNRLNNNIFSIITSVIIFGTFTTLEIVLLVYVFKFFLYLGWNAVTLYLILFFIMITPFAAILYNSIKNFPFRDFVNQFNLNNMRSKPIIK